MRISKITPTAFISCTFSTLCLQRTPFIIQFMSTRLNLRPGPLPGDLSAITAFHMNYYGKLYGWNQEFEAYVAKPLAEFVLRKDPREGLWVLEDGKKICGAIASESTIRHRPNCVGITSTRHTREWAMGKVLMDAFLEHTKKWKLLRRYSLDGGPAETCHSTLHKLWV
jgi:hypothetical protein